MQRSDESKPIEPHQQMKAHKTQSSQGQPSLREQEASLSSDHTRPQRRTDPQQQPREEERTAVEGQGTGWWRCVNNLRNSGIAAEHTAFTRLSVSTKAYVKCPIDTAALLSSPAG